jgi:hypothetical protein
MIILLAIWIVIGHMGYVDIMRKYEPKTTLEEMYDIDAFMFVTIAGPLIYLFAE